MKSKASKYKIEDIEITKYIFEISRRHGEVGTLLVLFTMKGEKRRLLIHATRRKHFLSRVGGNVWFSWEVDTTLQDTDNYEAWGYSGGTQIYMSIKVCLDNKFFKTYTGKTNIDEYFPAYVQSNKAGVILKEYMVKALNGYK